MDSARIYLGGVPDSLSGEEIYKHLSVYGRITEIKLRPGFGFVQFEHRREVVRAFSNQPFLGFAINVQLARPERYARSPELEYEPPSAPPAYHQQDRPKKMRYAVVVNGLDPRTCWQELKDFGRSVGGEVAFCDVDKDHRTRGWLNYTQEEDANRAVRELDGTRLLGNVVRLQRQASRPYALCPREAAVCGRADTHSTVAVSQRRRVQPTHAEGGAVRVRVPSPT
ncbi:hypothetical protein BD311DRAFT_803388 [Dichomitus squalens]|uniref:RRM domain-containing protein n=1 Tax=Dichomitus squalens TaxID=114155 RepID=A0A4Q9N3C0_9APHY|nr:hypothetical protein BD311DRAFT_803388 [Dichomitus squalens]